MDLFENFEMKYVNICKLSGFVGGHFNSAVEIIAVFAYFL